MATDGNLSRDGRHLVLKSKDRDLLETFRSCLGITASITRSRSGGGRWYWQVQWSDTVLYGWLTGIGLTPAKSLTLGTLGVPDEHFADFLRGCIDGDGSIRVYTDRFHAPKHPKYVYLRLVVSLVSASPSFVSWMRETIGRLRGPRGSVSATQRAPGRRLWCLKYGKRESLELIDWMYHASDVPCLARKRDIAAAFLEALPRRAAPDWRRPHASAKMTSAVPGW